MEYIQKLTIALALLCAYAPSLSAGKLLYFIDDDDSKQVENFLKNGGKKEVNVPAYDGWTPLHAACYKDNLAIVKLLLENGANPNATYYDGRTPLHIACCKNNLAIVKLLLENGTNPNAPYYDGRTPLSQACDDGNLKLAKLLLENGANPNTPRNNGWTPLYVACLDSSNLDIVKLLLANGANPNTPENNKATPLSLACYKNNLKLAKLLLESGAIASINTPNNDGKTPLSQACDNGNLNIVELLIKNGADATLTMNKGKSSLSKICTWNIEQCKKLLNTLVPTEKTLPQNTKTFIELIITTLAEQMDPNSTIAPKVPQHDGLFKSQVVENPAQEIVCIEEFIRLQLFTPHKKAIYTWPENFYSLNENNVDHSKCFKPSLSQFRCRYYYTTNALSLRQYAFLRALQNMARTAIMQPKAITYSSNSTSSKAKQYNKLCDMIIKCYKPSSTE